MLILPTRIRQILGKQVKVLRKKGILPGVLYGPKIKNLPLEIDLKEFEKLYKEAGESSLISLEVDTSTSSASTLSKDRRVDKKKFLVLIHEVKLDPLTEEPIHVDFYQPRLEEKVTAEVPLIFEGETPAVKDLGGTLVKNISEVEVKAKPQNLPKEIKVNVENLKTFEDNILIKDLSVSNEVEILKEPEEIVASVARPEKAEEKLKKPSEEKVEDVEKTEEEKPSSTKEEEKEEKPR